MTTPPAFDQQSFRDLSGTDKDQAERLFVRKVAALHQYLNTASSVAGLQARRGRWSSPRSDLAFQNKKFEPEHWYTFNVGGRAEAQLNVGMYPTHLRIGLGFEFTEREHGDPKQVREAFTRFYAALQERREDFEAVVVSLPVELELYPGRGGKLQIVPSGQVVGTLLDLPREPEWLFLGRLLRPSADGSILSDGAKLGAEIDRVFAALVPWWELSNRTN